MAAGRQVPMLASVADRDRAVRILQASFVEGRLAVDEFEQRLGLAMVSRDFRELLRLIADLPAGPFDRLPAHRVTPRKPAGRQTWGWFARLAQGVMSEHRGRYKARGSAQRRETGQVKLTDFGVVLPAVEQFPAAGTPRYLAPEVWRGEPATSGTDVYAAAAHFSVLAGLRPDGSCRG